MFRILDFITSSEIYKKDWIYINGFLREGYIFLNHTDKIRQQQLKITCDFIQTNDNFPKERSFFNNLLPNVYRFGWFGLVWFWFGLVSL